MIQILKGIILGLADFCRFLESVLQTALATALTIPDIKEGTQYDGSGSSCQWDALKPIPSARNLRVRASELTVPNAKARTPSEGSGSSFRWNALKSIPSARTLCVLWVPSSLAHLFSITIEEVKKWLQPKKRLNQSLNFYEYVAG